MQPMDRWLDHCSAGNASAKPKQKWSIVDRAFVSFEFVSALYQLLYHFGSAIADVYVCIILVCIILVQLRRYLFHLFEFRLDQFVRINFMCNAHCASILDSTIEVVYFRLHITLYLIVSVCCCRTVHLNCSTELCSQTPQPNSAAKLALSSNTILLLEP